MVEAGTRFLKVWNVSELMCEGKIGPVLPSEYRKDLKPGDSRAVILVTTDGLMAVQRGDLLYREQKS